MKRSRGRGRRPQNSANRTFDLTGPEIKICGSASHVYEKYLQLARDANSAGDRVMAENYLQHAEHYFRVMSAAQAQQPAQTNGGGKPVNGNGADATAQDGSGPSFSLTDEGDGDGDDEEEEAAAAE